MQMTCVEQDARAEDPQGVRRRARDDDRPRGDSHEEPQRPRSRATTAARASAAASRTRTSTASARRCRRRRRRATSRCDRTASSPKCCTIRRRGRARGVRVIDAHTMEEREFTARVVFLCASTIESVRLLLNSKSTRFPDGLANSSGTARPLRDGPPLRLGRVGHRARLHRQAHDRPSARTASTSRASAT